MMTRTIVALVTLVFCGHARWAAAAEPSREPLVEQVRVAIARGVQYLRDKEGGRGGWEHIDPASTGHRGGWTSIALLALLNAGVKPDDPLIERGLKTLRQIESNQTYVVSLQTMVYAEVGRTEDRERIQRNVDWLLSTRVMKGDSFIGWGYGHIRGQTADNSNSQYALLGLHAGHLAGAKIEREVWESIRAFYTRTQLADGGWVYNPLSRSSPSFTMTTAGLCGLLIAGMELNPGREVLQPDGSALNCGFYEEMKPLGKALGWISQRFRIEQQNDTFYSLYGVERAGRLSGLRFFGDHDWYREGSAFLVRTQNRDNGSWVDARARGTRSPIIGTSFALLFLSKGRTPILISKLVHGPGEDWNNDRNDARNLVAYAGRELFQKQPMAWQIFDARRTDVRTNDDLLGLVGDLLQSPIVYFNGHQAARFTDVEKSLLKQYVDQGGFILAEACCGRPEFDQGFRQLMKELFPDSPLKKLAPEHPVWRAHTLVPPNEFKLEGIELGCKTVVMYSPQDLSCLWEGDQWQAGRGQLAFRLAGNIIAYATGMEPPKPRLTVAEVLRTDPETKQLPRGYLKVAQLRHDGDWQPAPRAMQNLMAHLRGKAKLDVALQTEAIRPNQPDLIDFKLLYMHGRANFSYTSAEIQNIRVDLGTGGLLFADACCGKQAFDTAFRAFATKLFPEQKLEPIPLGDDLYSQELNGTPITSVRRRTEVGDGTGVSPEFRDKAPYLEGIKLDNRWVVIYSKYDIGCALEKHQSTDCLGHDHASALRLSSAVVWYALMR